MKLLLFSILITPLIAYAVPSHRPLPAGMVDEDQDFLVLRDHEHERTFFLTPKKLVLHENALQPFGDQIAGCGAVADYNRGMQTLVETKKEHAEASLKRTKIINELLLSVLELQKQTNGSPTEVSARLEQLQAIQTAAETEQNLVLKQITALETSLEKFVSKIALPTAKVRLRLRPTPADLKSPDFRKQYGFSEDDTVALVPVLGMAYYPGEQGTIDFLQNQGASESVGNFTADWSPKPYSPRESDFGQPSLTLTRTAEPFPQEILFEQIVSLYTYCALQASKTTESDPIVPVRVNVQVAEWVDQGTLKAEPREWGSFSKQVDAKAWAILSALPEQKARKIPALTDPGAPKLFTGQGSFQARAYSLGFKQTIKE